MRACQNPYPVIDGRRANCNLAAFGAQENYPTTPQRGWQFFWFLLTICHTKVLMLISV
jgi:hypothetical protein